MAREWVSDVVVMHPHSPMRLLLRRKLAERGYCVTETSSYRAALRHLRETPDPMVVVAGNLQADFGVEQVFFGRIATDAALAARVRVVLFCALPEWMPGTLRARLRGLGVPVLRLPSLAQLLISVDLAAGRLQLEGKSAG
jgi:hypothetical protein